MRDTVCYTLHYQMARTYVTVAAAVLALCGCGTGKLARQEVTVAAAANLTTIFQQLGPRFEAARGIHLIFSALPPRRS
jgi:ABC-type molybdate transport system substrate-binding protein